MLILHRLHVMITDDCEGVYRTQQFLFLHLVLFEVGGSEISIESFMHSTETIAEEMVTSASLD